MAEFGGIEGFSSPPGSVPDLEHWFAQISAEIEQIGGLSASDDETITGDWTFSGQTTFEDNIFVEDFATFHPDTGTTIIQRWLRQDLTANTSAWDWRINSNGDLELRSVSDSGTTNALVARFDHDADFDMLLSQGVLRLGTDTNLYRDSADVLATDDEFRPLGDAAEGSSAARPIIHHETGTASAVGIQGALHTEDV